MRLDVAVTPEALNPADLPTSTVLVVDVLRASTTIITALGNGCVAVCRSATRRGAPARRGHAGARSSRASAGVSRCRLRLGNSPLDSRLLAWAGGRSSSTANGTPRAGSGARGGGGGRGRLRERQRRRAWRWHRAVTWWWRARGSAAPSPRGPRVRGLLVERALAAETGRLHPRPPPRGRSRSPAAMARTSRAWRRTPSWRAISRHPAAAPTSPRAWPSTPAPSCPSTAATLTSSFGRGEYGHGVNLPSGLTLTRIIAGAVADPFPHLSSRCTRSSRRHLLTRLAHGMARRPHRAAPQPGHHPRHPPRSIADKLLVTAALVSLLTIDRWRADRRRHHRTRAGGDSLRAVAAGVGVIVARLAPREVEDVSQYIAVTMLILEKGFNSPRCTWRATGVLWSRSRSPSSPPSTTSTTGSSARPTTVPSSRRRRWSWTVPRGDRCVPGGCSGDRVSGGEGLRSVGHPEPGQRQYRSHQRDAHAGPRARRHHPARRHRQGLRRGGRRRGHRAGAAGRHRGVRGGGSGGQLLVRLPGLPGRQGSGHRARGLPAPRTVGGGGGHPRFEWSRPPRASVAA